MSTASRNGIQSARGISPGKEAISEAGRRFIEQAVDGDPILRRLVLEHVEDIRLLEDIDTARVRMGPKKFLLELSPKFVATMLPSRDDKRFVLMHEIKHVERGDLLRQGLFFRRYPRMVNFAMDIFVNGAVFASRNFATSTPKVLDRCYDPRSRPWCLLQPPWRLLEAWSKEIPEAAGQVAAAHYLVKHRLARRTGERPSHPRSTLERLVAQVAELLSLVGFRMAPEAARLYLGGWTGTMPFSDFLVRFHRLLGEEGLLEQVEGRPLLLEQDLEAIFRERRRQVLLPGRGSSLARRQVSPELAPFGSSARRIFFQALAAALVSDPFHPTLRRDADVTFPSVLLHMGRREAALLAAGAFPILFHAPGQSMGMTDERVHVYLDVSGSMVEVLELVMGLTLTAGALIGPDVHQFSSKVVTITWDQLESGHVETTGGTDLDCVAQHARRHGYRRILVVTDGLLSLEEESRRILGREMETFMVVVGRNPDRSEDLAQRMASFARKSWAMPPL